MKNGSRFDKEFYLNNLEPLLVLKVSCMSWFNSFSPLSGRILERDEVAEKLNEPLPAW
jgi:hypothetical protein